MSATRFWWLVGLIMLLALGWRAYRLSEPAFDHDEVYELTQRTTDLSVLVRRHDGFPPLYRWLVALVRETLGTDASLRWFSLVCGVLTVPLVALLGRRLVGPQTGLVAAIGLAISANHVLLSQHGRGYALLVLLATAMLLTAWRLRASDRWRDWFAFLVVSWLGVATHYYVGLLLVLLGGLLLIEKRGFARMRALAAAGVLALAGLPLVECLRVDLAETGEFHHEVSFDKEAYAFSYLWLGTGNTLGPSVSWLRETVSGGRKSAAVLATAPWACLLFVPAAYLFANGWRRLAQQDRRWMAVLLLAPPPLTAMAAAASPTGYNYRYLVWMLVPLIVVLAAGVTVRGRSGLTWLAVGLLIALSLGATLNRHFDPAHRENDFHEVTRLIAREDVTGESPAVIAAPLYFGRAVLYELPASWPAARVTAHPSGQQDWEVALPRFAERVGERQEVWLVTQWFPVGHPQRAVCDALVKRLDAELVGRVSSTVMVYRLSVDRLGSIEAAD
ncbi:glycosyltransferase family 39 protein [Botrimarina hoheduenensis]|uniref:glycosyltransferase family 39 protein n=1 Tax=Botrimarina hoheduenensis TaxID=2528000 RepID=UPI001E6342BA|nr:glycosyltransferase family 39 protein [Botrimarina hoheduenensis]